MRRFIVGALITVAAASACEKVNSVASSVSPCFRVLPQARTALGGQGTLVDVARISRSAMPSIGGLARRPRATTSTQPGSSIPAQREVCLVAYKGSFDASKITHLIGPGRTGRYAIVVISIRSQQVRAVELVDRLPKPLHNR
jgi:hypothetical protein